MINSNIHLPCLTALQQYFNTSEETIQTAFVMNAFVAMFVSIVFGVLADLYGRKHTLLLSTCFFILGTVIIIQANTIYAFFLGRFFQCLGDAGAVVVSGVIIGDYYKQKNYAKVQSILSIMLALAWAGAPLMGERIFVTLGWKGNFVFVLILSLIFMTPLFFWKEKKKTRRTKITSFNIFTNKKRIIPPNLRYDFVILSLIQAVPLGIFTAFELMLPFIYIEHYGYSVRTVAISLFIFISLNIGGSFFYMIFLRYLRIKFAFPMATLIFISYVVLGLYFFTFVQSSSNLSLYLVFGLLSFSLPFMQISSSMGIVNLYPQHLGVALSLLAIIRNAGTTAIPFLVFSFSENTFFSLFNLTLVPALITVWLLYRILMKQLARKEYSKK